MVFFFFYLLDWSGGETAGIGNYQYSFLSFTRRLNQAVLRTMPLRPSYRVATGAARTIKIPLRSKAHTCNAERRPQSCMQPFIGYNGDIFMYESITFERGVKQYMTSQLSLSKVLGTIVTN